MDSLADRIKRSIAQRGAWGTVKMCAVIVGWTILPTFRKAEEKRKAVDDAFDREYGVDTGGVFRPKCEDVVGENWSLGGNYQAIDPLAFRDALGAVSIPHEEFTFIDFGSGKGRTLLIASGFPFKRVIGVEYCKQLNDVAQQNILRFPASARRCDQVESIEADATQFPIPDEPLVVFLNNPFAEPVMSKVVKNVVDSFRRCPRRIVVIYFWPNLARLWEETGLFRKIQSAPAIFDTGPLMGRDRPPAQAAHAPVSAR